MDGLSMADFVANIEAMRKLYPNAVIRGIGYGCRDHQCFYVINLQHGGKIISYEFPMYSHN